MRAIVRLLLPFVVIATACGRDPQLPTAPSSIEVSPVAGLPVRGPSSSAEIPFTVESIAADLASEINLTFIGAMEDGLAAAATGGASPNLFRKMIDSLIGVRVHAQQGFRRNCSRRGQVHVRYFGGTQLRRATLASTPVSYTDCTFRAGRRDVTFNAEFKADNVYTGGKPSSPVKITGDVMVEGLGGYPIELTTGLFPIGTVQGVHVGPPDTPPPPNPEPLPPGTLINVTGTWGTNGVPVITFQQMQKVIKGRFVPFEIPHGLETVLYLDNYVDGTVNGNEVDLNGVLVIKAGDPYGWTTMTFNFSGTLRLNGSTLSGTLMARMTSECTGEAECVPPSETSSVVELVRTTPPEPVQNTSYNVTGRWSSGTHFYDLTQDGGGTISGTIGSEQPGTVVEPSLKGRIENSIVTLDTHMVLRQPMGGSVIVTTWTQHMELSVYDTGAMGGLLREDYKFVCENCADHPGAVTLTDDKDRTLTTTLWRK